jgi:hypothetical protein
VTIPQTARPANLSELEALAEQSLDPASFVYYAGGAGDEISLGANVAAWPATASGPG